MLGPSCSGLLSTGGARQLLRCQQPTSCHRFGGATRHASCYIKTILRASSSEDSEASRSGAAPSGSPTQQPPTASSTSVDQAGAGSQLNSNGTHAASPSASADSPPPAPPTTTEPAASVQKPQWSFLSLLPPASSMQLLASSAHLLRQHFWVLLLVYILKDGCAFLLHRGSQRITNAVSDGLLGTTISLSTNPWWLYLDSAFLESNMGYQVCIVLFFLLSLPLNIFVSSAAATMAALLVAPPGQPLPGSTPTPSASDAVATISGGSLASGDESPSEGGVDLVALAQQAHLAQLNQSADGTLSGGTTPSSTSQFPNSSQASTSSSPLGTSVGSSDGKQAGSEKGSPAQGTLVPEAAKPGLMDSLRAAFAVMQGLAPSTLQALPRVWWVDCLFNLRALPLQALSLLVAPLPWTVPRLLAIQLAVPIAILEGQVGQAALQRSGQLMQAGSELMAAYGWPFVALILAVRLLDGARNLALACIPSRWWQDVVEVPLIVTAAFAFAKLLIIRMQDLLPLAAYLEAKHREMKRTGEAGDPPAALTPKAV